MSDCCCLLLGKDNLPSLNANGPAIKGGCVPALAGWRGFWSPGTNSLAYTGVAVQTFYLIGI